MVRNEASRYLPSALKSWGAFSDQIIALDDNSTDNTRELLKDASALIVHPEGEGVAWGREWQARKLLWDAALEGEADWAIWLDADMVPLRDPRALMLPGVDALAFNLYDLWASTPMAYRADSHWQAHRVWRIWACNLARIRKSGQEGVWNERGIHCGHMPSLHFARVLHAPPEYGILHYGYLQEQDRIAKRQAYTRLEELTPQERAHAESITSAPHLVDLGFEPHWHLHLHSGAA